MIVTPAEQMSVRDLVGRTATDVLTDGNAGISPLLMKEVYIAYLERTHRVFRGSVPSRAPGCVCGQDKGEVPRATENSKFW